MGVRAGAYGSFKRGPKGNPNRGQIAILTHICSGMGSSILSTPMHATGNASIRSKDVVQQGELASGAVSLATFGSECFGVPLVSCVAYSLVW